MEESSNRGGHLVYLRDVNLKYSDKPFFRPFRYSVADQDRYRALNPHIKLVDPSAIRRARRGPAHEELKRQLRQKINPNCNQSLAASKEKVEEGALVKRPREDDFTGTLLDNTNLTDVAAAKVGGGSLLKRPREDLGNSTETSFEISNPEKAGMLAASAENPKPEEAYPSAAFVDNPKTE